MFRKQIVRYEGTSHFVYSFDDRDYIKRLMTVLKPNVIIYAAGINDMLECHLKPKLADMIHSLGPVFFSAAAETVPHRYIYLSTSYVYDGRKGSYVETDVAFTETTLGRSKMAGENYIRGKSPTYTVFRLSPVVGLGSVFHPSFVDRMRNDLAIGKRHEMPENEHHSFLFIDTLLEAVEWAIQHESRNETYNLGGLTKLSTYEFGVELARKLGLDHKLIVPTKGTFKDHAFLDFSLNGTKFVKNSQINPLILEESLDLFQKLLVR